MSETPDEQTFRQSQPALGSVVIDESRLYIIGSGTMMISQIVRGVRAIIVTFADDVDLKRSWNNSFIR